MLGGAPPAPRFAAGKLPPPPADVQALTAPPRPAPRRPPPQDGGKFKVSRRAALEADGVPPPPSTPRAGGRPGADGGAGEPAEMPEVGKIYRGCRIVSLTNFGAFVEVGGGGT